MSPPDEEKKLVLTGSIGTPNRKKPRYYNILRPYFGRYRSPLRPGIRFGLLKFPWETHIKRWPTLSTITISYFTRFSSNNFNNNNLFETLHSLPLRGIGYIIKNQNKLSESYLVKDLRYQYRPFKGIVKADLMIGGKVARSNIIPRGSMGTQWEIEEPNNKPVHIFRTPFPNSLYSQKYL